MDVSPDIVIIFMYYLEMHLKSEPPGNYLSNDISQYIARLNHWFIGQAYWPENTLSSSDGPWISKIKKSRWEIFKYDPLW